MIFAGIATEMGMVGAISVVVAFVLLVGAGFRVAQTARSDFSRLMATGLTLIIGFQAFFIMAGVVRLLPFTGITLPFVAYGGSSLLANYILIALMLRISDEGAKAQSEMQAAGDAGAAGRAAHGARPAEFGFARDQDASGSAPPSAASRSAASGRPRTRPMIMTAMAAPARGPTT